MRLYSPQTLALITLHLPKKEIHNNLFSYSCSVNEITFLTLRYNMPETLQISEVHHMQQFHSSAPSLHIAVVREVPGPVAHDLSAPLPFPAAGHPHRALLTLLLPQEVSGVREGCGPWINPGESEWR